MTSNEKDTFALSRDELANIEDAVVAKYGAFLKPGEWISIDVTQDKVHCHTTMFLENPDGGERLELESVVLDSDNDNIEPALNMKARFDHSIDFLDSQLESFFEDDRHPRFHDDWRLYQLDAVIVRFRGRRRHPDLEQLADQWLAANAEEE